MTVTIDPALYARSLDEDVTPFQLHVSDSAIQDLHERLRCRRLPEPPTVSDLSQGIRPETIDAFCQEWLEIYDWRTLEAELNDLGQWQTGIDGLPFHFLHVRSARPDARPILVLHGWPSSVVEALDLIPLLVNPPAGQPAFHVVAPSLPGFGFSGKPSSPGWKIERIADAFATLMHRLGYPRFLATGGDWGAMVTTLLSLRHPERVAMLHTPVAWATKPEGFDDATLTATEKRWLAELAAFRARAGGRAALNGSSPQSLAYALTDSPAGQLAWILEGVLQGTDRDADGTHFISHRRMLDNVSVYWFSASAASSARLYWESIGKMDMTTTVEVPTAVSVFEKELMKLPRAWTAHRFPNLRHWNVIDRGGHFAMLELPEDYARELRAAAANITD